MALESFYGGKQGISPVIKKSFWFIEDDFKNEDFFIYVWNKINSLKNNNSNYSNISLPNRNSGSLKAWLNSVSSNDFKNEETIQEILNNIMNTQFAKGNEYTEVWYSEYCIIDSPNKNFKDNGKLFRRTLNSRNENNIALYAEYIGTLRGPVGQNPKINITSLTELETAFDNLNKYDSSLSYPKGNNDDLKINSFKNIDTSEDADAIKYSWYQIDTVDGETSEIHLGFSIPAPQIQVGQISTLPWKESAKITVTKNNDNPFKTTFNFEIPRGIKGTSVDNVQLRKLGDFKNLNRLLDFLIDDELEFFINSDPNTTIFNNEFFTFDKPESQNALDYYKENFLHYFNKTAELNPASGKTEIDENKNWCELVDTEINTDKKCWFYFLEKIIDKTSIAYSKIEKLLKSHTFIIDQETFEEESDSTQQTQEITINFFNDKEKRILPSNDNLIYYQNIISEIKELLILTYDIIFYDAEEIQEDNFWNKYTFFLCEQDGVKEVTLNEDNGDINIDFYYKDPVKFAGACPWVTSIVQEPDTKNIRFIFNNGRSISTQFDIINKLQLKDGKISYVTQSNNQETKTLNPDEKDSLWTYRVQKEDNKIYVYSHLLGGTELDPAPELLGEFFDLSFKGILSSQSPISGTENYTTDNWTAYLNDATKGYLGASYPPGLWIGTENLGGRNNWYVRLENSWAYADNALKSWPAFSIGTDEIEYDTDINMETQERVVNNNNYQESSLINFEKIVFGKLNISKVNNYNPFKTLIPQETNNPSGE